MPIQFNCPMCGNDLKASDKHAGKSARCKHCGEPITIPLFNLNIQPEKPTAPHIPESLVTPDEKPQIPKRDRAYWDMLRDLWRGDNSEADIETEPGLKNLWPFLKPYAIVILGLAYLGCATEFYSEDHRTDAYDNSTEQAAVVNHLTLGPLFFLLVIPNRIGTKAKLSLIAVVAVVAVYVQLNTGLYRMNWTSTTDARIYDQVHRKTDKPFHRSIFFDDDDYFRRAAGPLAETGSRHGRWEFSVRETFEAETVWYWHGEIVTEAEFFRLEAGR